MSEEEKQDEPVKRPTKVIFKIGNGGFVQSAVGDLQITVIRKSRWERFVNLILLPWRYIWHGKVKL